MKSQILKPVMCIACALTINASFAQWSTTGTNIYNNNAGNVGIGTSTTIDASAHAIHITVFKICDFILFVFLVCELMMQT